MARNKEKERNKLTADVQELTQKQQLLNQKIGQANAEKAKLDEANKEGLKERSAVQKKIKALRIFANILLLLGLGVAVAGFLWEDKLVGGLCIAGGTLILVLGIVVHVSTKKYKPAMAAANEKLSDYDQAVKKLKEQTKDWEKEVRKSQDKMDKLESDIAMLDVTENHLVVYVSAVMQEAEEPSEPAAGCKDKKPVGAVCYVDGKELCQVGKSITAIPLDTGVHQVQLIVDAQNGNGVEPYPTDVLEVDARECSKYIVVRAACAQKGVQLYTKVHEDMEAFLEDTGCSRKDFKQEITRQLTD